MAQKAAQTVLYLALLAYARAVPMTPFAPFGLMGHGGMLGPGFHNGANSGARYSGPSIRSSISAAPPSDRLTGTHIREEDAVEGLLQGFHIVIKPVGMDETGSNSLGDHHFLGGHMSPFAAGIMGVNAFGFGAGHGLLGFGGHRGMFGKHGAETEELEAVIEVVLESGVVKPFEVMLVFLESAEPGIPNADAQCDPTEQGAVLTWPRTGSHGSDMGIQGGDFGYGGHGGLGYGNGGHGGLGYGNGGHGGLGYGNAGYGYGNAGYGYGNAGYGYGNAGYGFAGAAHHMLGMGQKESDPDAGVISTLTLQAGTNTVRVRGLGPFTKIEQLAGRGVGLCLKVAVGSDGRLVCDIDGDIPISFCAILGYDYEDGGI